MRSAALTFALLIILSGAAPAAALVPTGVDGGQGPHGAAGVDVARPTQGIAQVDEDMPPAATEMRIQLEADADARWTITYRYHLADENEVEAFRSLATEYEAGRVDIGLGPDVFRTIAERASTTTDREMQIRDVQRSGSVERNATPTSTSTTATATATATATETTTETTTAAVPSANATGTLRLSFTWTNFLQQRDDGSLRLGDVFTTVDGGTWFSSLGRDQRLTIVTPPGYVISRTGFPIQQQNDSLVIDGPREFSEAERISVTYRPSAQAELPWTLITGAGVAVVVVLALIGAFAVRRGRDGTSTGPAAEETATTNGGESPAADPGAGETTAGGGESVAGTTSGVDEPVTGEPADDEEPDFELLSDEERVEYLLEERGGRMKQANIVKETGWSDAKVSQLLSSMADEGRVEKLRLGRENLISLPDDADTENEGA